MQTVFENLFHSTELQLCQQTAGQAFGIVQEAPFRDTGEPAQGGVERARAKTDRTGKILVEHKKLSHVPGVYISPIDRFISVPRAAGMEDTGPFDRLGLT